MLPTKVTGVLGPFEPLDQDPDHAIFADGLTHDIISRISKLRWLFVIARGSTFTFRAASDSVEQVARALGAPPYIVASDRTLRDIARMRPSTPDELALANGIGPTKLRRFGQGLLDVALHPDFADNGLIYLSYSAESLFQRGTEVARARLDDGRLTDLEVILEAGPKSRGGRHFGSRLAFAPDGRTARARRTVSSASSSRASRM